jgi:transposase-like protein
MQTKRVARRKHSAEFRAEVVQACQQAGASVAAIAQRNGLNANVVYRWLREDAPCVDTGAGSPSAAMSGHGGFVAVQLSRRQRPRAHPRRSTPAPRHRRGELAPAGRCGLRGLAARVAWLR